jgi:hypothetical protein
VLISWVRLVVVKIILAGFCCLVIASGICYAGEPNGIVRIEGKCIKQLVFSGKHREVFTEPNESITLPVGTYQIFEIELQDEYVSHQYNLPPNTAEITVKEGNSVVLKFGAPLTQSVKVERRGNLLQLSYKLQGIGGEVYSNENRDKAPQFAVYKGDAQIGSGAFKYG